jgi:pimeloyl-ACP methyl ester carboxylesterase
MNSKKWLFGFVGLLLVGAGVFLLRFQPYRANTVISTAGGCQMRVDIVEPASGEPQGYVVLLHGLAASKRVMFYLAEGFANQDLRVFVPDLPGHGRTPGPFSPHRAEFCTEAFVKDLIARRAIVPERTILAGHSMGGAIALLVGGRIHVAGVIAISPAPMRTSPGIGPEMLPFHHSSPLPPYSLVMSGGWEPAQFRASAASLLSVGTDESSKYVVIPHATHVSLLFDSRVAVQDAEWGARVLQLDSKGPIPSHWSLLGFLLGFAGLAILAVPFLHEMMGSAVGEEEPDRLTSPRPLVSLLQVAFVSALVVVALRAGVPLRWLHIFQGDYLVSFFLLGGIALLAWNWKLAAHARISSLRPILTAVFAAIALILLFGAWFDLSLYEAWLTLQKWLRFPAVALLFFPWLLAEEFLLGPAAALLRWRRVALALCFRALAWSAMAAALFLLHSGEILLVLLSAYFAIFFVLERMAAGVVRRETHSPVAAAVFGAILFAGLTLAIFPVA